MSYTEVGQPVICHACGAYVAPSLTDAHERSHGNWLRPAEAVVNGAAPRDLGAEVDKLTREVRQHGDQLWSSRCRSHYRPGSSSGSSWVQCGGDREGHAPREGAQVIHRGQDTDGAWHEWGDN